MPEQVFYEFKPGVPQVPVHPLIYRARSVLCGAFRAIWHNPGVITSTSDGKHSPNSRHYRKPPEAEDYRLPLEFRQLIAQLDAGQLAALLAAVNWMLRSQEQLGPQLRVILEKDHVHVQTTA